MAFERTGKAFNRRSRVIVPLRVGFTSVLLCALVQFAGQEEKRQKNERLHQHQKHENQMRDLQLQCDSNIRELQQLQVEARHDSFHLLTAHLPMRAIFRALKPCLVLQNEKCHLLIEHETQKLKELDEEHSLEMKEWREKLRPRKKVFYRLSVFYSRFNHRASCHYYLLPPAGLRGGVHAKAPGAGGLLQDERRVRMP